MTARLDLSLAVARGVGALARRSGRGGGTSLPGKVLLRLDPHAIRRLSQRLADGSVVISATNGKTTTAALAASILARDGRRLVNNSSGANMAGGIASTLMGAAQRRSIDGDLGLFEVDEFWLEQLAAELQPRALVLGNLFRDQLDRYGELETIAGRWADVAAELPGTTRLVLNADDPVVAALATPGGEAIYFGVGDPAVSASEMQHAADATHCRNCGSPYEYDAIYVGHLGHYRCPGCGFTRPRPDVTAEAIELQGTDSSEFTLITSTASERVRLPLPGLYNVYNALAAAGLCLALDLSLTEIARGLEAVTAAFGRAETVTVEDHQLQLLLIKNPAGANEIVRTLALTGESLDMLLVLNDKIADGRDVSWVWDADFELLVPQLRTAVCAGSRAAELAVRLKYAGVPTERLQVVPELDRALDAAIAQASGPRIHVLPTYTAMLAMREELTRRGHVAAYWETAGR